jgi:hypothetical protein
VPQTVIFSTDSVPESLILLFHDEITREIRCREASRCWEAIRRQETIPRALHKPRALVILSPAPLDSRVKLKMPEREEQRKRAKECANRIKSQRENGTPYPKRQHARAMPNQGLREIFGIDNGFTNLDRPSKMGFTQKAEKLMLAAMNVNDNNPDGDWVDLRRRALTFFDEYMHLNSTRTVKPISRRATDKKSSAVTTQMCFALSAGRLFALKRDRPGMTSKEERQRS